MTDASKRHKDEETQPQRPAAPAAQAITAAAPLLPLPPAGDRLAGVGALKSGRGLQLRSPAAAQLLTALSLFDDAPGGSDTAAAGPGPASGSAAAAPELPTGASWPLVSLVTANSLQTHAGAHAKLLCLLNSSRRAPTAQGGRAPAGRTNSFNPCTHLPLRASLLLCSGAGRRGGTT